MLPQPPQPAATNLPPANGLPNSALSVPVAKHANWPVTPASVQTGGLLAVPPVLTSALQRLPLNSRAATALPVVSHAQIAFPRSSGAHPSGEWTVEAVAPT